MAEDMKRTCVTVQCQLSWFHHYTHSTTIATTRSNNLPACCHCKRMGVDFTLCPAPVMKRPRVLSSEADNTVIATMDMDEVFDKIGQFGRYQKRVFVWYAVYQLVASYFMMVITFAGRTPQWDCVRDDTVPTSDETSCRLFEAGKCVPKYSTEFTSIVSEWDLICSRSSLPNWTQSALFLGFLIGSWAFGWIADQMGRRKAFLIGYVALVVSYGASAVVPSFSLFLFCRFVIGFASACHLCYYVLVTELIGREYRSLPAAFGGMMFAVGFTLVAVSAYLIPSWRPFTMLGVLLLLCAGVLFRYLPESPQWLLVKGREEEAMNVLRTIARGNGVEMSLDFKMKAPVSAETTSSHGVLDLFSSPEIRKRTVLSLFAWFTVCMAYYALSLGVGNLSSNLYLSFSLSGLVEIPSNLSAYWVVERLGRRWTNSGFILLGGAACLCCAAVQVFSSDDNEAILVALSLLGKFAIAGAFLVVYVYSAELFPTEVRSLGIGVVNIAARAGGILAPLVILLDQYFSGLYMLLMGTIAAVTGVLCLSLPETLNTVLPATLKDLAS